MKAGHKVALGDSGALVNRKLLAVYAFGLKSRLALLMQ